MRGAIDATGWRASNWRAPRACSLRDAKRNHDRRALRRASPTPSLGDPSHGVVRMRLSRVRVATLSAFIATALVAAGCKQTSTAPASTPAATPPATTKANDSAALASAVDAFIQGAFERNPVFAANAGKHEFDGKLPDYSTEGLKSTIAWLHAQRDKFAAFGDDRLDETGRYQRDYVVAVIDGQLFWLEDSDSPTPIRRSIPA